MEIQTSQIDGLARDLRENLFIKHEQTARSPL
jgi:hypothetical protein